MVLRLKGLFASLGAVIAAAAVGVGPLIAQAPQSRSIAFYNIHTKETLSVIYKRNGRYLPEAMDKIDWIMRDWRKNQKIRIDPELVDLLWEMHAELGSREPIHLICGHRTEETNNMLRRTVGGQASGSQHITGKAADVHFPDVPLKNLRYSALIRERGGVGYYPTSAIPFVHVDTSRVRHWPRMPRYELALLFPQGRSQHVPADGNPITRADVATARANHAELTRQVAQFLEFRRQPKTTTLVADAGASMPPATVAPTARPEPQEQRVASLAPVAPSPQLVTAPRLVERSSRFTPGPSHAERQRLDELVTLAQFETTTTPARPAAEPVPQPPPTHERAEPALASLAGFALPSRRLLDSRQAAATASPLPRLAAVDPAARPGRQETMTDAPVWGDGWVRAPAYDEEHPDELSYRPFPLAPLLTDSPSVDDPTLVQMVHPDLAQTLELIGQEGLVLPMRFRPGQQVAELLWAQQFRGDAVNIAALTEAAPDDARLTAGLKRRTVQTSGR